ncbi:MAG: hypothetical protein ACOX02_00355 [Acholeplasmatales bacterium]
MRVSINIKYDYNDSSILKEYIPTVIHSNLLEIVLRGVLQKNSLKSHVVYGPYGSGKSYIGSILTGILTKKYINKEIGLIKSKFSKINNQISSLISEYYNQNIKYIPIIINGYEGKFNNVIIEKIINSLEEYGLDYKIPTLFSFIIQTVELWQKKYPNTYKEFIELLKKESNTIKKFKKQIDDRNSEKADWFISVFPQLTSGQKLQIPIENNVINVLQELCQILYENNYGVFIIYDEFGRYLQNLEIHQINLFMQEIQDLAELANNGLKNFQMILISHKPISSYFSNYEDNIRYEFAKIEKRFTSTEIKSDDSMFISIASNYIKSNRTYKTPELSEEVIRDSFKYQLFNSYLSDFQISTHILKDMYPMHPLSIYILPEISRVFGQNERTLFTFLNDKSKYGLYGKLLNDYGYIYCDSLVDYFFDDTISLNEIEQKKFMLYNINTERIKGIFKGKRLENLQRVLKFIFLWSITKRNNLIPIKSQLIAFALDIPEKEAERNLTHLENEKFIRFNVITKEYEIYESSGYDIEEELVKAKKNNKISDSQLYKTLNKYNKYKYFYSEKYNVENEITRFAKITYVKDIKTFKDEFEYADLHFVLNFDENVIIPNVINGYIPNEKKNLLDDVERLYYLDFLLQQNELVKNSTFKVELEYEKNIVLNSIREIQKEILIISKFVIDNENKMFRNIKKIEGFINEKFEDIYNKSIKIANEQINMFNISSPQLKALTKIIDNIVQEESLDIKESIENSSIMKLAFYSIVNNVKEQKNYKNLKENLIDYLIKNPEGKFIDLLKIVISEPFGVRPPVAVTLLITLLIDKWQDILIYKNNTFVSIIRGEELFNDLLNEYHEFYYYSLFNEYPSVRYYNNLTYVYSEFDNQNRPFLEQLEKVFDSTSDLIHNKSLSIRVCSSIHNWFINLPIITQQGERLSVSNVNFLDIIKNMRITPRKSLEKLITFTPEIDDVISFKKSIESNYELYLDDLEKEIKRKLDITNRKEFIMRHNEVESKFNKVVRAVYRGERIIDQFVDEIEGIDMKKWTNSSFIRLKNHIIHNYAINQTNNYLKVTIGNEEKAIQPVTLSPKGENTLENIENTIEATSKYMTQNELENIIISLFRKYVR